MNTNGKRLVIAVAAMAGIACGVVLAEAPSATPVRDASAWDMQLGKIRQQLDIIKLFSLATAGGGMLVNLPGMVQAIPTEDIKELSKANIKLDLKSIKLVDLQMRYEDTLQWQEERPAIPSLVQFSRLVASLEAKTPLGKFPVKCSFKNGVMPLNFECKEGGYEIRVIPESRQAEAKIEEVAFDLGGPLANHVSSKLFGRKVADSILQFGMGQTLKMDKGSLLGGQGVSSVLDRVLR